IIKVNPFNPFNLRAYPTKFVTLPGSHAIHFTIQNSKFPTNQSPQSCHADVRKHPIIKVNPFNPFNLRAYPTKFVTLPGSHAIHFTIQNSEFTIQNLLQTNHHKLVILTL
ncbi:hypothetical protein, partial [Flavobacterium bernardetii]